MQGQTLQDFIINTLDNSKAQDIVVIDVSKNSSITDTMIICTGTSSRHVMSIADNLVQVAKKAGLATMGLKGAAESDWIVVDLGEAIVHILQDEARQLYELEKLWG